MQSVEIAYSYSIVQYEFDYKVPLSLEYGKLLVYSSVIVCLNLLNIPHKFDGIFNLFMANLVGFYSAVVRWANDGGNRSATFHTSTTDMLSRTLRSTLCQSRPQSAAFSAKTMAQVRAKKVATLSVENPKEFLELMKQKAADVSTMSLLSECFA